jgi:hypothetical protein
MLLTIVKLILVLSAYFKVLLILLVVSFLDSASKVSNGLTHHHFLSEGTSLKELFQVFLIDNLTIWSSCYTLVMLDI